MAATRIKVPQLANGTDGELITWDASGVPTTVAVGTSGQVLTSNGVGAAPTFQAAAGGASSGISGAVQFSDGAGGFLSDATNFFFNNTTDRLEIAGSSGYGISITSSGTGGITNTTASAVTGDYVAYKSQTNATGAVTINVQNTNTVDVASHARLKLTAGTGGGDPFISFVAGENEHIIGFDQSGGKFFLGRGTSPSGMTTSNITFDQTSTGIFQTAPTAYLHVGAGTTTAAPFKFTSGTNLTTPQAGAMEWDGTNLFVTQTTGPTRKTIAYTSDITGVSDGDKVDITVSASGATWTINALAVTNAKINDVSVAKLTSGTVVASLTETITASSTRQIKYSGSETGIIINDTNNSVGIYSKSGSQAVLVDNTSSNVFHGTTKTEFISGVIRLWDSNLTNYVGIQPPSTASLSSNYTLTLPDTAGSANQVLTTDGTGVLTWSSAGNVNYAAKTANYTITATDNVIDCTANSFTVTLPTAVGLTGKQYSIKNSASGQSIIVDPNGAETIDGGATYTILFRESITICSTGTNWIII